jgi:hypothetical protein
VWKSDDEVRFVQSARLGHIRKLRRQAAGSGDLAPNRGNQEFDRGDRPELHSTRRGGFATFNMRSIRPDSEKSTPMLTDAPSCPIAA